MTSGQMVGGTGFGCAGVGGGVTNFSSPGRSRAPVPALRGQQASLHTERYIAANSPSANRWLSPSVDVICASTMLRSRRRPAVKHALSAGSRKSFGVVGDEARVMFGP